jgi:hypothetical protein
MTAHDTRPLHGAIGSDGHFNLHRACQILLLRELGDQGLHETFHRALLFDRWVRLCTNLVRTDREYERSEGSSTFSRPESGTVPV